MNNWNIPADDKTIEKTQTALKVNNIDSFVVANGLEAKKKVLELIPQGAEVMTNTSVTADMIGLAKELNESGNYNAVKPKLFAMDRKTQGLAMNKLGAAAEWSVGSVHAVTQEGNVVIASQGGSQLPGYAYGSQHVVWVVGTQKIVKTVDEGIKRIYEYSLPLESERANKAYNSTTGSNVNKMLIINKEMRPNRITLIFIKENIGF